MSRPIAGIAGRIAQLGQLYDPPPSPGPGPAPIVVPLAVIPRLVDATVSDPSSLGVWSEVSPGRLRFAVTGFAAATALDGPLNAATLTWPITTPEGDVATYEDVALGLAWQIAQVAGVPGVATAYAIHAGICSASRVEYAMSGIDHALSVSRGAFRITGQTYNTNLAASVGRTGKLGQYRLPTTNFINLSNVLSEQITALATLNPTNVTVGYSGAVPNRPTGLTIAGLRYFLSFTPRGVLASQPADIDVDIAFHPTGLALSRTIPGA